jgi:hypothetical protein
MCSLAKYKFGPNNETLSEMSLYLYKLASFRTQEGMMEPDNLANN